MAIIDNKKINEINIGYHGWCKMGFGTKYQQNSSSHATILVQVTSLNITRNLQVPTVNPFFAPHNSNNNKIEHAIRTGFGLYSFQGNITCELSNNLIELLLRDNSILDRNNLIFLQVFDGLKRIRINNCVWNSIQIQGNPNSIATVTIAFQTNNGFDTDFNMDDTYEKMEIDYQDFLIPYWQTGRQGLISFSLSFDRNVTPVYLNNDYFVPTYFRPGIINMSLTTDILDMDEDKQNRGGFKLSNKNETILDDDQTITIYIGSKQIKLNYAILQSMVYNIASLTDIGAKSYSWVSIPLDSDEPICDIGS